MSDSSDHRLDREAAERLARRPWPATPIRPQLELTFELFPPRTDTGRANLARTVAALAPLAPAFVSVTCGAGGSSVAPTAATVEWIAGSTDLDAAAHLTCVGATVDQVHETLDHYRSVGVNRIVALRGDDPADGSQASGELSDARSLVELMRARSDGSTWDISVAAYPEVHPRARSAGADLDNLRAKIEAGADRALTQFFFDSDDFLRFRDRTRDAGITAPIVPGIMPVTNFDKVAGFARRCGATVPAWMGELFGRLDGSPDAHRVVAATVAAEQCRYLAERGVGAFHFYTMNRSDLTLSVCRMLGLSPAATEPAVRPAVAGGGRVS